MLFINIRQIARQMHINWGLMIKLDSNSTEAVFVKNYKIQISRSDFTYIHVYLCRVSFLTILDIYKDYFKGRLMWCKVIVTCILCPETICPSSSFSLEVVASLHQGFCDQGASWSSCWWIEELCSQHSSSSWCGSHILGSVYHWLVMYWDSCIERRDCHYITSLIGY